MEAHLWRKGSFCLVLCDVKKLHKPNFKLPIGLFLNETVNKEFPPSRKQLASRLMRTTKWRNSDSSLNILALNDQPIESFQHVRFYLR